MADLNDLDRDIKRLRQEYARRSSDGFLATRYSADNHAQSYMIEQRHQAIKTLLGQRLKTRLSDLSILEIGCGSGGVLSEFESLGADETKLFGLDLLHDRLLLAQQVLAFSPFVCGNCQSLPFLSKSFDLLLQFTAFSSILNKTVKVQMASEMSRVLKSGGAVIWYDFIWNPTNPQTRGIRLSEIRTLFEGFTISPLRITLAPPLIRMLVPKFHSLANGLSSIKFLNSHLLVWIQKTAQD